MSLEKIKSAFNIIGNELLKPMTFIYGIPLIITISRYYKNSVLKRIDPYFSINEFKKVLSVTLISLTVCGMALAAAAIRTVLILKEISSFYQIIVVLIPLCWTLFFFTPLMKKCITN